MSPQHEDGPDPPGVPVIVPVRDHAVLLREMPDAIGAQQYRGRIGKQ